MNRRQRSAADTPPIVSAERAPGPVAAHQALDLLDRAIVLLDGHGFDIAAAKAEEASVALRQRMTMH